MKVKCKINDLAQIDLSAAGRLKSYVYGPGPDYELELDEQYYVQAIELMRGGVWIYIETSGRDYPFPYPIEFFEVVDSTVPIDWIVAAPYRSTSIAIVSFRDWANDPNFYEKLLDDSSNEISIYESKRKQNILDRSAHS